MTLPKVIQVPWDLYNKYFLSEKQTNEFDLEWRFHPIHSYNKLVNHKMTNFEIVHYTFLTLVNLFVFVILPISFFWKFCIFAGYLTLISIPITSQLFFNGYPVLTWVFLFFSSSKIPDSWRPPISVKVLPATETIFFGDNLSNILAASTNPILDVLAWIPYGMIHFIFPFVLAAVIWFFAPPTSLRSYGMAIGYMNLVGVMIQNIFPSAPPWYKLIHRLNPADYSMPGSPGGLGRIDTILGFDMYTTTFENSPVVFGAFPSLHSGSATMEALFLTWLFPKGAIFYWAYVSWLWWCTMYLTHHYFIDLIAGSCLSVTIFTIVRYTILPIKDSKKFCRFSYSKIDRLSFADVENGSSNYSHLSSQDEELQLYPMPQQLSLDQQANSSIPFTSHQQESELKSDATIRSRNGSPILNNNVITEEENVSTNSSLFDVDINMNSSTTSLSSLNGSSYNNPTITTKN